MKKQWFLTLLILSSICWNIAAQQRGGELEIKTASGEVVVNFAEAHALIIGESVYTNGWRRLPGVKKDVAAVSKLFKEQGFNVVTIEDANSRNLKSGITNFLDKYAYNQNARIVVYFAGHGATVDLGGRKMGYIVPVDAPLEGNNSAFLQTAIPMTQFETWAKQYTSRHIMFIFDSCFAGTVFRSQGSAPPAINRLIGQPVRQFITSGDADEEVPDESIFRKELEYALGNAAADTDNDGYVSGTELGLYLFNKVSNYMNGKQNPRIGKLNDTNLDKGDFIFAVSSATPQTVKPAAALTPVQPAALPPQAAPAAAASVQSAASGRTYNIGDIGPAGGIVFYDKGVFSGSWRYLEAAPAETEFTAEWGAWGWDVSGTSKAVGNGKRNTQIIVERLKKLPGNGKGKAAMLCVNLNFDGFNDWFLPSNDELDLMYNNLKQKGLGGFSDSVYWSSSQIGNPDASCKRFGGSYRNEGRNIGRKDQTYSVRAVRAF